VRRSCSDTTDLTAYMVFAPEDTTLEEVVRVAGMRWTIESCFKAARGPQLDGLVSAYRPRDMGVGPADSPMRSYRGFVDKRAYHHVSGKDQ
jgi:hypothetical protein